jgi:3-oxoacyl-[acyl-carrier-protein] synthase III
VPRAGQPSVGISRVAYRLPRSRQTLAGLKRSGQIRSDVKFLDELGFKTCYLHREADGFDDLLIGASLEALSAARLSPAEIGTLFLYSGLTSDAPRPGRRSLLQRFRYPVAKLAHRLALTQANAMALSQQGCCGLLSAINLAAQAVQAEGAPRAALCVAGDVLPAGAPREVMYNVMSDAAAAVVVERNSPRNHLITFHQLSQPSYWDSPHNERELIASYFPMAQRAICGAVEQARLRLSDIRWIVPSNVSLRSWTILAEMLEIPADRIWSKNIARIGHTVCCDHIINLADMDREGALQTGDYSLLFTFGFGASWTSMILRH